MRTEARSWAARLALCAVLLSGPSSRVAGAQAADGSLAFASASGLAEEDHAELELRVSPPPGGQAWMVTLRAEGTAIEVVRGRLLPSDVVDPEARPLVLRVPIVARARGLGIVHAHLAGWSCTDTCHEVALTTSTTLRVSSRRTR